MRERAVDLEPGDLQRVTSRGSLFDFLRSKLGWPLDPEDPFTYPVKLDGRELDAEVSRLVRFSSADPYPILLVETAGEFRRSRLREVLRLVRRGIRDRALFPDAEIEDLLFVVASEGYRDLRFCRFTERPGAQPRLSAFGWRPDEPGGLRTLAEHNLPALAMPPRNLLGETDWSQARWHEAWNVERVTEEFFREYRETFHAAEAAIAAENPGKGYDWRLLTQRLFNRLLFIQFLSRKRRPDGGGWMDLHGRCDYLPALLEANGSGPKAPNFYHERLHYVFFGGLALPPERKGAELRRRIGDVPYLNGGLFQEYDATDSPHALTIPNDVFESIIRGLFARWNFTVTESTPLDVDVAVDPEMLGKVFEELVTGRHETGSYYTPRPVVAFMCREALKGYLAGSGVVPARIAALVDQRQTSGPEAGELSTAEARELLKRLMEVRVVDPACGSGAYLLGMLHELFELAGLLEVRAEELSAADQYHRKLRIIRNCLYGVDVDEFAVNIARLRLWLSLAVEFEGAEPEPLPNLDFKIETGDSLLAPNPSEDAALEAEIDARVDFLYHHRVGNEGYEEGRSVLRPKPRGRSARSGRCCRQGKGRPWSSRARCSGTCGRTGTTPSCATRCSRRSAPS